MTDDLTLYNITDEMSALDEILAMDQGEVTEETEELENRIYELLTKKVDSTCGYVQKLNDMIGAAKAQKDRLDKFIKQKENKIKRLGDYVQFCLEKSNVSSFQGELYEMKIRKPSQVLKIADENKVPLEFTETTKTVKILKAELKKAVKAGKVKVDGIELVDGKTSVLFTLKQESRKPRSQNEQSANA